MKNECVCLVFCILLTTCFAIVIFALQMSSAYNVTPVYADYNDIGKSTSLPLFCDSQALNTAMDNCYDNFYLNGTTLTRLGRIFLGAHVSLDSQFCCALTDLRACATPIVASTCYNASEPDHIVSAYIQSMLINEPHNHSFTFEMDHCEALRSFYKCLPETFFVWSVIVCSGSMFLLSWSIFCCLFGRKIIACCRKTPDKATLTAADTENQQLEMNVRSEQNDSFAENTNEPQYESIGGNDD